MNIKEKEQSIAQRLLKTSEVKKENCYVGGKWCATCMYMLDHDQNFNYYENAYCQAAKR